VIEHAVSLDAVGADQIEPVGISREIEHADPDDLLTDPVLDLVREIVGGRWDPDMSDTGHHAVSILVGVTAEDGSQREPREEVDETSARYGWNVPMMRCLVGR